MKRLSVLLCLALTTGLTVACEKDDNDDKIVVAPAPPTPSLTEPTLVTPTVVITLKGNTFDSTCLALNLLDMTSSTRRLVFGTSGEFAEKDDFFLGDTCGQNPYLTYELAGTYTDAAKQTEDQEVMNVDYLVADAFLTVHAESLMTTFNVNAYCGKSDWVMDERVSLKDLNCAFIPGRIGTTVSDVYASEDKSIYFGNNLAFDTKVDTVRPADVDRDIKYSIATAE